MPRKMKPTDGGETAGAGTETLATTPAPVAGAGTATPWVDPGEDDFLEAPPPPAEPDDPYAEDEKAIAAREAALKAQEETWAKESGRGPVPSFDPIAARLDRLEAENRSLRERVDTSPPRTASAPSPYEPREVPWDPERPQVFIDGLYQRIGADMREALARQAQEFERRIALIRDEGAKQETMRRDLDRIGGTEHALLSRPEYAHINPRAVRGALIERLNMSGNPPSDGEIELIVRQEAIAETRRDLERDKARIRAARETRAKLSESPQPGAGGGLAGHRLRLAANPPKTLEEARAAAMAGTRAARRG